ncbi:MAG: phosphatase PAP2 family protein [Solirubrobacteraceae bacterium]
MSFRTWLLVGVALILLVVVLRWILSVDTFSIDVWAARVGDSRKPWLVWYITRVYQQVGRPLVAMGEVLVMFGWLYAAAGRRASQGLVVALMASVSSGVIKIICGPTPLWLSLADHVGTNFPSGVVTFMTASWGYIALVAWRTNRRGTFAALAVLIVASGPARVVGGQHLATDTLGGYMLGAAWLIGAYLYLTAPVQRSRSGKQKSHAAPDPQAVR